MPANAVVTELLQAIQHEISESVGESLSDRERRALKIGRLAAETSLSGMLSAETRSGSMTTERSLGRQNVL